GAGHDVLGAGESRELCLELGDLRAIDELAMVEHAGHRVVDRFAEPAPLGGDVDEGHGRGGEMLVHGALQELRVDIGRKMTIPGLSMVFAPTRCAWARAGYPNPQRAAVPCARRARRHAWWIFRGTVSRSR